MKSSVLITNESEGYALLQAGDGEKLERFGAYVLHRPDPQALFSPMIPRREWKADAKFVRDGAKVKWHMKDDLPKSWNIEFGGLTLEIRPTSFKHTGLFPEQESNWNFIREKIKSAGRPVSVINLFAYTGGATLAAAQAGADVTHVDGSKSAIEWARKNQELSGLSEKNIRYILEDVVLFLKREIKRGHRYDGLIMDPPKFGHGGKGEVWKIEESFAELMKLAREVLSDDPLFFIINGYASGYSPLAYRNSLLPIKEVYGGDIETGELALQEKDGERLLPTGIFARWSK